MSKLAYRLAPLVAASAVVLALAACGKKEPAAGSQQASQASTSAATKARPLPVPPPAKYVRDHYGKLEDCVFDWGYAGKCFPVPPGAAEKSQGVSFFGPTYSDALRLESQLASRKEAVERGYVSQLDESPSDKSSAKSEVKA